MKSIAVTVSSAPGVRSSEAMRAAGVLAASGHRVSVAFIGEGVLSVLKVAPECPHLAALRTAGVPLVAELESLGAGAPADGILPQLRPQILGVLAGADLVLGF